LCSEPVEFIAEYRCFVHKGMIVDCRRYQGDYRRLVDIDTTARRRLRSSIQERTRRLLPGPRTDR
jgi:hypothetical protein